MSVARCARVSYLNHEGQLDFGKDIELHDTLLASKHSSAFEHVATPEVTNGYCANFKGWEQYRSQVGL